MARRDDALVVEDISNPAALESLVAEWSELFAECPQLSPFQSPEWLLPWRRRFLSGGLWTLAVRCAGRLVALLPAFIWQSPTGDRQVTLLGNGLSDRLDLIARPADAEAVAAAVMTHLARNAVRWTSCDFRDLSAGSPLLSAKLPLAVASDEATLDETCPAARLPADPGDVLAVLPKTRRTDLRRCARRLAELGPLRFETAEAATRGEHLQALARLHGARWSARGEQGVLAEAEVLGFHDEATAGLVARGWLRLQVLRLGERIIAAHYALKRGERGYSYLHAFDPEFSAFGPGWLVMAHSLQAAAGEGVRDFDFLRGREPYKYAWGASDQLQHRRRIRR